MTTEALEERLTTSFRIYAGMWNVGMYSRLAPRIPDEARIICAAEGLEGDQDRILSVIVTEDRIYLTVDTDLSAEPEITVLDRSEIHSMEMEGDFLADVTLETSLGRYRVRNIALSCARALKWSISGRLPVGVN